ncbi:MAG: lipoate--protein ligase family protein [Chlamydiales bacterium]|nr:lipoate--protein ligase family protein [Chlamydiales bacterium]
MKFTTLFLENTPIVEQLYIEEALLRADNRNICIINTGAPSSIVMGISGKPEELIEKERAGDLPIIKRFSGGGTVVIDPDTVFVTFICNSDDVPIKPHPLPILEWGHSLYKSIFEDIALVENDFVFGKKKFGGNAQYIRKGRWLLHTSFLWDYCPTKMAALKLPQKRPDYRNDRSHTDFLCTLKERFRSKEKLVQMIRDHFTLTSLTQEEVDEVLQRPHRRATVQVDLNP